MKGLTIKVVTPETLGVSGVYAVTEFDGGLRELQAAVGGLVEAIPTDESVTIWCNDEGKLDGLPPNRLAMDVWIRWDVHGCMAVGFDWIAGDVVVTGGVDGRGETLDLGDDARRWVARVARDAGAYCGEDVR